MYRYWGSDRKYGLVQLPKNCPITNIISSERKVAKSWPNKWACCSWDKSQSCRESAKAAIPVTRRQLIPVLRSDKLSPRWQTALISQMRHQEPGDGSDQKSEGYKKIISMVIQDNQRPAKFPKVLPAFCLILCESSYYCSLLENDVSNAFPDNIMTKIKFILQ